MPLIKVTDLAGNTRQIEARAGLSLMEVLREESYEEILAMCGGCCSCATCHVYLKAPQNQPLPVIEEDEALLLELSDNFDADLSRLSCQIELMAEHDGLEVTLVEID